MLMMKFSLQRPVRDADFFPGEPEHDGVCSTSMLELVLHGRVDW
jgi:hypothetical protein